MAWRSFPQRVGKWLRRRFLVRTWKSQLERWTVIQETDRSQSQTRWAGLDSDRGGAAFRGGAPEAEPAPGSRGARHCVQTFATCRTPAAFLAAALTLTYGRLVTLDRLAMAYPGYGGAVSPREPWRSAGRVAVRRSPSGPDSARCLVPGDAGTLRGAVKLELGGALRPGENRELESDPEHRERPCTAVMWSVCDL